VGLEDTLISPNTITVDLVDIHQHLKPTDDEEEQLHQLQQQHQSSLDELAAFEGDPLEWLIETGVAEDEDDCGDDHEKHNAWLPESSLPFFPDLNKPSNAVEPTNHCMVVDPPAVSDTMVEDAITNNMVDPNVTVQSLFLPGETNPF